MLDNITTILIDLGGTLKVSGEWRWYSDAQAALERLSHDYTLVVAANQPAVTHDFLKQSSFDTYFSKIYVSESIGITKPDGRFFKHILGDMRLNPKHIAMVGDKLSHDIIPAKAVGIRTIWLNRENLPYKQQAIDSLNPDYIISTLGDLR